MFEALADKIAPTQPHAWTELPIDDSLSASAKKAALRLNALGSLFNFEYVVLGYTRLTRQLHDRFICKELECERIHKVIEFPRDFFKTTCATIGAPMWWALPFTEEDEKLMRQLGYGDEWIRWMKRAHNTCTRTLIASEVTKNALKMSDKIANHYLVNRLFQWLFREIQPTSAERWNQNSLIHRRLNDGTYQSEGTYDFIGAEAALQSNHYERHIEDDVVGEDAARSDTVMHGVIEWHKKLPGCFDSIPGCPDELGDQLVINNRWSERDLSAHIRSNERHYQIVTHSSEGGCCEFHPPGMSIFPEEYSMKKLALIRQIEGDYNYACHYPNNPIAPEAVRFKSEWLRIYDYGAWVQGSVTPQNTANYWQLSPAMRNCQDVEMLDHNIDAEPRRIRAAICHEVQTGEVIDDIHAKDLDRIMLLDPNHSGEYGRTRNAILVLGIFWLAGKPRRIYFLDAWAKACGHEEWIEAAIGENATHLGLAFKWKIHRLYIESETAGQQGWKFFFKEKLKHKSIERKFSIMPLKTDRSENAKTQRIIGMEPVYSNGLFWMPRSGDGRNLFMDEYTRYPNGATLDLLDLAGYSPQAYGTGSLAASRDALARASAHHAHLLTTLGPAGY